MDEELSTLMDKLVPRGGKAPACLHVTLEEYLARVANLYLKIDGVHHRLETWVKICEEHILRFDKDRLSWLNMRHDGDSVVSNLVLAYEYADRRLANEFEMFLYSVSSALTVLTRIVAAFLKGATDSKSHNKLVEVLTEYPDFELLRKSVQDNNRNWIREMKERRDAATHYIGLSIRSISRKTKDDEVSGEGYLVKVAIPKIASKKTNSVWDEDLPVVGGTQKKGVRFNNEQEVNGLFDPNDKLILIKETVFEKIEMIDGVDYVDGMYKEFRDYTVEVVDILTNCLHKYRVNDADAIDFFKVVKSYTDRDE